jgi:tetratricopeptide (TPR) repeat protein
VSGSGPRGPGDETPRLATDRYTFKRKIGRGGQGDVWLVHDAYLGLDVALKLLPRGDRSEEDEQRFRDEAQRAIRISAVNVIRLYDYNPEVPYLVMEFCDGGDLTRQIMSRRPAPVRQTLQTVRHICEGLAALHEQPRPIVHRDLKPGNVLFQAGVPKIVDFGLSKDLAAVSNLTRTRGMMGTVNYASPEQLQDASKVDARTDLWAVGVILREMLTWERPFDRPGDDLVQVVLRIRMEPPFPLPFPLPDALASLITRALQKDPAARFPSAREMAAALGAAAAAIPPDLVLPPADRVREADRAAREAADLLERGDAQGALAATKRLRSLDAKGDLVNYWEPQARSAARGAREGGGIPRQAQPSEDARIGSIRSLIHGGQHREARRRLGQLLVDEPGNTMAEHLLGELAKEEARVRAELDSAHQEADEARARGDLRGLIDVWERMAQRVPEHPEVKAELAVARKELALETRNLAKEACEREALALAERGDQAGALRRWETFRAAYPDDADASSRIRVLRQLLEGQAALGAARERAIEALLGTSGPEAGGADLEPLRQDLASLLLRSGAGEDAAALSAVLRSATQALGHAVSVSTRRVEERAASSLSHAQAEGARWQAAHAAWRSLDDCEARIKRLLVLDARLMVGSVTGTIEHLRGKAAEGLVREIDLRALVSTVEEVERAASSRLEEARLACERVIARLAAHPEAQRTAKSSPEALKDKAIEAAARSQTDVLRGLADRALAEERAASFRTLAAHARKLELGVTAVDAESRALLAVARTGTAEEVRAALETLERARRERGRREEELEREAREAAEQRAQQEAERKAREEVERRVKEATERKAREEAERKIRAEAAERARREEQRAQEEAARKAREEAEHAAREEAAQRAKAAAERARREEQRAQEEAARTEREEAERKAREEAEREARKKIEQDLEIQKLFREGQALIVGGRLAEARQQLETMRAASSSHPRVRQLSDAIVSAERTECGKWLETAQRLLDQQSYEKALRAVDRALGIRSNDSEAIALKDRIHDAREARARELGTQVRRYLDDAQVAADAEEGAKHLKAARNAIEGLKSVHPRYVEISALEGEFGPVEAGLREREIGKDVARQVEEWRSLLQRVEHVELFDAAAVASWRRESDIAVSALSALGQGRRGGEEARDLMESIQGAREWLDEAVRSVRRAEIESSLDRARTLVGQKRYGEAGRALRSVALDIRRDPTLQDLRAVVAALQGAIHRDRLRRAMRWVVLGATLLLASLAARHLWQNRNEIVRLKRMPQGTQEEILAKRNATKEAMSGLEGSATYQFLERLDDGLRLAADLDDYVSNAAGRDSDEVVEEVETKWTSLNLQLTRIEDADAADGLRKAAHEDLCRLRAQADSGSLRAMLAREGVPCP